MSDVQEMWCSHLGGFVQFPVSSRFGVLCWHEILTAQAKNINHTPASRVVTHQKLVKQKSADLGRGCFIVRANTKQAQVLIKI